MSAIPLVPSSQDIQAFHELFEKVSLIGRTPSGGMHRLAASHEDGLARDLVVDWLRSRGFSIGVDPVGNIFAYAGGHGAQTPCVMSGSHLDSQPSGGRFDGAYGVVAACVAADIIRRSNRMEKTRDLCVAIWTNEEGARFTPSMMGSGVYTKQLDLDLALSSTDASGVTLKQALQDIGYHGLAEGPAHPLSYVELHIEQGPELEAQGVPVGVVEGHWGTLKYVLTFKGRAAHTGPTPMSQRQDALLGAGHFIVGLRDMSDRTGGQLLTSVGRLQVSPNSSNVIAETVQVFAEMRCTDNALLQQSALALEHMAMQSAQQAFVTCEARRVTERPAGTFDATIAEHVDRVCQALGLPSKRLFTVAGHDAIHLGKRCPSGMIFVPSAQGVSHHEAEYTSPKDLETGLKVLTAALSSLLFER